MLTIIRVIWGNDIMKDNKFNKEFVIGCDSVKKFCSYRTVFYVYGKDNTDEVKKYVPEEDVVKICDDPLPYAKEGYNHWYHKPKAIQEARKAFKEILYLDFDATFVSEFSEDKYNIMATKKNSFPWYLPSGKCHIKYRSGEFRNRIPCNGFLYFTSDEIIDEWIKSHSILKKKSDEQSLAHACENIHGVLSLEEFQNLYEPLIIQNSKQPKKDPSNICLVHPYELVSI